MLQGQHPAFYRYYWDVRPTYLLLATSQRRWGIIRGSLRYLGGKSMASKLSELADLEIFP
jgi:hypothetical protein